ncbi:SDR family oxidoreductase [Paenibacillus hunanensis]|uniref:SDR family oxidoreductase n=1 Tax=Paenibacillus hunanensis TaxID=539262 RepID=UPI0020273FD7|nr:SDR family oxidoreductase [Paenibacillus hunanensis]MCL9661962.1 SDR family oxidoreductase [Paenibacillus hunanensis]
MNTRRILITGANSGMGLASSIALAKQGHEVIMACRNEERGQQALKQAREQSGSDRLKLMQCDLGSLDGIHQFAEQFYQNYDRLDVLLNNAGVVNLKRKETKDGFEMSLGVNHLGHFLLTRLLLDAVRQSPSGRIVTVASGAYKIGKIHWDDPNLKHGYTVIKAYAQSKLANLYFNQILAEQLQGTNITANCLHPGAVATSIGVDRDTGFGKRLLAALAHTPFFQTPEQGAETAVFLATDPSVEGQSGHYYYRKKVHSLRSRAMNREEALRLWEWSEQQTGIESSLHV